MRIKFLLILTFLFIGIRAYTQDNEQFSYHFQLTGIWQAHSNLNSPYFGNNSLLDKEDPALSVTSTLFFGSRLWKGASLYFNPELGGGRGISGVTGIAGFINGEIYRVGESTPKVSVARLFLRQHLYLSGKDIKFSSGVNQISENVTDTRITLTVGRFSVSDIFDNNSYSHDARTQFINWSLMSNGAWDYPADTRGYTFGTAMEYYNPEFVLRICAVAVPKEANGLDFDLNLYKAHSFVIELEKNYKLFGETGTARIMSYYTKSHAGIYTDAIQNKINRLDTSMNINSLTTYGGNKLGFGLNIEQQAGNSIGIFLRAGWNDGSSASWAFTEIDRTLCIGTIIGGKSWKRTNDTFGMAVVLNGISKDHRDFLKNGGYGFIIGDGKLPNYGLETIFESYYSAKLTSNLCLTPDYQFVINPAYNKDRGPVSVFSLRTHIEF